jgi:hypothetical protein
VWVHELGNDVYVEMTGSDVSIWLCKVRLPNLVKYLPVSSASFVLGDNEKGFKMLWDKVDAIAVAGREADARQCASLSLLQAKVSEIAEKSERQITEVMKVSMGSQNVQKNKPVAAVSNRAANYHKLTNIGEDSADW